MLFILLLILGSCGEKSSEKKQVKPEKKVVKEYGYILDDYQVINDTVKKNESFGEIMDKYHLPYPMVLKIAQQAKPVFDVKYMQRGKPYTILASKDSLQQPKVFIYKYNPIEATVVDFQGDKVKASVFKKKITTVEKEVSGTITTSLSEAMDELHLDWNLITEMADIYAWTLDFLRLQKGDSFKIIYDEKFIKDTIPVGVGAIKSAVFKHEGKDFYAFRFEKDTVRHIYDYFDDKGDNLRRQFLKSPIKFKYRISSRYSRNRKHPVLGYRRAHKGTDFAARRGTPIIATANGTVIASERRGGNGNYVKIRHNATYTTQYLHMSRRKARKGQYVKQGDVIGYVGSTGLATGPHVCYRFWKNGVQVDPFRQKLPTAEPMPKKLKPRYFEFIAPLKAQIDKVN
ncbi:MAG: peptidoglycan DD-metalloendopeptidase family protein [Flavobacteriaceae bacterium]|nr:peptidoglycan DD-metalloendopeptidase family protein [Flavobacteriaceae bacterium]